MNTTKEQRKAKAIELLEKLDVYKPYVKGFKDKDMVCFFEQFGGYWVYQEPEIEAKMKEIEEKHSCTVWLLRITPDSRPSNTLTSPFAVCRTHFSPPSGFSRRTGLGAQSNCVWVRKVPEASENAIGAKCSASSAVRQIRVMREEICILFITESSQAAVFSE